MTEILPTIYYGVPEPGADTDATNAAVQDLVARFNEVPPHLFQRIMCSFVLSVCAAQIDPIEAFQLIGINVGRGLTEHLMKPEGSA